MSRCELWADLRGVCVNSGLIPGVGVNSEVILGVGMIPGIISRWNDKNLSKINSRRILLEELQTEFLSVSNPYLTYHTYNYC